MSTGVKKRRARRTTTRPAKSPTVSSEQPSPTISTPSPVRIINQEVEEALNVVQALSQELGRGSEPNTALLLYALLQAPTLKAHNLLGTLRDDVRARLAIQSLSEAQLPMNGISLQHIRYAAERIAVEVCNESEIDSRHLLMVCLVGSGLLGGGPELGILDTSSKFILGRSNTAVRAMEEAGVDALHFLETVRAKPSSIPIKSHPGFYVFWAQPDRTRLLWVEDVGEFEHQQIGRNIHYPSTLGLLDSSTVRNLQALLEFESMVNDIRTPENKFQKFFEQHPEFLMSDEYVAVQPGILLSGSADFGLKPDFFLQRRDTPLWDLAELKLPSETLVRGIPRRRGLAAAVRSAMDQLRTYKDFFLDNNLAENFRRQHGLEIYYPRLTLIIGRDASFGDYHERQRLSPPEVRLLTYDDLVRIAKHRALVLPFVEKKLPPKR